MRNSVVQAAALGAVSGMRSMLAPALLARALAGGRRPADQPARALASTRARGVLAVLAAGELVADKLPFTPPRTEPPSLAGRAASGALVGAALAVSRRQGPTTAALAGALGAVVASFGMMHLRRAAGERLDLPDPLVALAEDALALSLGRAVLRDAVPGRR